MARRPPAPLAGRTAVITGAASGIGKALARRLSRCGSPVALTDVDAQGLSDTAASLTGPVLARVLDVRDATAMTAFAAGVQEWAPAPFGAVVNNAGVAVGATVLEGDIEDDAWLHDINFHGVVNGTRAFLPLLVAQGSGTVVNLSSVFGLVGMPNQSAYCAAKFAVRGFTESLRQELRGTGVRAATVHPGGVDTGIVRHGRFRHDPEGRGRDQEELAREFAALTLTTPDQAARIIHQGIDRGRARILVGPDAYVFDLLARVAPTHYYDVLARLQTLIGRGRAASRGLPGRRTAGLRTGGGR